MRNHKSLFGIFSPIASSNNMYIDMLNNIFLKLNSSLLGYTQVLRVLYVHYIQQLIVLESIYSCSYQSIVLYTPQVMSSISLQYSGVLAFYISQDCTNGSQSRCNINTPSNKDQIILPLSKILSPNHSESKSIFQNLFPALTYVLSFKTSFSSTFHKWNKCNKPNEVPLIPFS